MDDSAGNVSNTRRWSIVWLLFAAGVINYLDRAVVSVALPLIAADFHQGPAAKGVLLSAFFWSYALMQLPMGWCADRYNLRWFYAGGFALWSLACGLTGFAGSLAVMLVLRMVLGIGESVYLPGGVKIVSLLFDSRDRGLASGLVNCGTRVGLAVGVPLIAWLVATLSWRKAFLVVGFASLVWIVPWLAIFPSRIAVSRPQRPLTERRRWQSLDRNLLGLCLGHIGFSYYWTLLVTWLPDYLVGARHMPIRKAGAYAVIPYLVFSISEPLGGWMADRLVKLGWSESRSRKGIVTFAFLTSLCMLPGGLVADDAAAVWLIGAASLVGLATGNILSMLQRSAPPDDVGLWTGMLNFVGNLAGIMAPLAMGLLIASTGSYFPGLALAVAILLVGLPAYWWIVTDRTIPLLPEVLYEQRPS
jgi:MFS family permease